MNFQFSGLFSSKSAVSSRPQPFFFFFFFLISRVYVYIYKCFLPAYKKKKKKNMPHLLTFPIWLLRYSLAFTLSLLFRFTFSALSRFYVFGVSA